MSEVYRILSNKCENRRTLLGFGDHRYFHAWAAGRAGIATRLVFACAAGCRCVGVSPAAPSGAGRGGARPPGTLIPRGSLSRTGGCVWIIQSPWDSASGLGPGLVDWLSRLPPPSQLTPPPPPRVPGGSGPCGDLCLPGERVQVGLHLCPGWLLGRTLPAWKAQRKSGRTHLRPFPTPTAGRGRVRESGFGKEEPLTWGILLLPPPPFQDVTRTQDFYP